MAGHARLSADANGAGPSSMFREGGYYSRGSGITQLRPACFAR